MLFFLSQLELESGNAVVTEDNFLSGTHTIDLGINGEEKELLE